MSKLPTFMTKPIYISKKQALITILGIVAVGLILFGIKLYIDAPRDLGTQLEYIGQHTDYCFLICDGPAISTEYYFGTEMNQDEVKTYFKHARYNRSSNVYSSYYTHEWLVFRAETSNESFVLSYYSSGVDKLLETKHLYTTKPYIVSINKSDYETTKTAFAP